MAGDEDHAFRHTISKLVAASGDAHHRGFDLVAAASATAQTLGGVITYSHAYKGLEDEDVEVYACVDTGWNKLGTARTDGQGRFSLLLTGDKLLPVGMRDLYVSVLGDRTGAAFLAYVAPEGSQIVVSDVDGTLTSSENEFLETVAFGADAGVHAHAPAALQSVSAHGYQLVYVTARGNRYTEDTRRWLAAKGFPRGPVRMASSLVTLPGQDTVDYKTKTFTALETGLSIFAGIGNRDSDITAYTNAGVPRDHIFIALPEFSSECQTDLDASKAIGFADYATFASQYVTGW